MDRTGNETGRSGPDKEGRIILSSMHRKAGLFLLLGMSAVAVTAQEVRGQPTATRISAGRNGFKPPY